MLTVGRDLNGHSVVFLLGPYLLDHERGHEGIVRQDALLDQDIEDEFSQIVCVWLLQVWLSVCSSRLGLPPDYDFVSESELHADCDCSCAHEVWQHLSATNDRQGTLDRTQHAREPQLRFGVCDGDDTAIGESWSWLWARMSVGYDGDSVSGVCRHVSNLAADIQGGQIDSCLNRTASVCLRTGLANQYDSCLMAIPAC